MALNDLKGQQIYIDLSIDLSTCTYKLAEISLLLSRNLFWTFSCQDKEAEEEEEEEEQLLIDIDLLLRIR